MIRSGGVLAALLILWAAPAGALAGAPPASTPSPEPSPSPTSEASAAPSVPVLPSATASPTLAPISGARRRPAKATPSPSAAPSPSPSPTDAPVPEDPAVTTRAKAWYERLRKGSIDRSQLTSALSAALTNDQAKAVVTQIGPLGTPVTFAYVTTTRQDPYVRYEYELTFKDGSKLLYRFVLDGTGKVAGLFLQRAS